MEEAQADRLLRVFINKAPELLLADNCRNLRLLAEWLELDYIWGSPVVLLAFTVKHLLDHTAAAHRPCFKFDRAHLLQELLYQFNYALDNS